MRTTPEKQYQLKKVTDTNYKFCTIHFSTNLRHMEKSVVKCLLRICQMGVKLRIDVQTFFQKPL